MDSAFGVDHGEFSKGIKNPRFGRKHKLKQAQQTVMAHNAAQRKAAAANATVAGKHKVKTAAGTLIAIPGKVANKEFSIAGIGQGTAKGVRAVGTGTSNVIQRYPGTTGTAVVGGSGYALYRSGRKKKTEGQ